MGYRSLDVIEIGTIQNLWCGFLFTFYSNYGAILHRWRDTANYGRILQNFYTPPVFSTLQAVTLSEFREAVRYS